jgi:hypothetical protein
MSGTNNLYLVFSRRPPEIGRDEYHEWYTLHAQENIESPGFVSAQRYAIQEVQKGQPVGEEQHLAVYQYEGDMSIWRQDLTRRIENGEVNLPDFFNRIAFTSWACTPVGGLLTPQTR